MSGRQTTAPSRRLPGGAASADFLVALLVEGSKLETGPTPESQPGAALTSRSISAERAVTRGVACRAHSIASSQYFMFPPLRAARAVIGVARRIQTDPH